MKQNNTKLVYFSVFNPQSTKVTNSLGELVSRAKRLQVQYPTCWHSRPGPTSFWSARQESRPLGMSNFLNMRRVTVLYFQPIWGRDRLATLHERAARQLPIFSGAKLLCTRPNKVKTLVQIESNANFLSRFQ